MHKKTFILVHGSWHNAWNWYKVKPLLEQRGHTAYALDLPGMGRDKTPIKEVTFAATIDCLCRFLDQLDTQVILVGHSKNGVLISQLAEQRPDQVEKLIYLAAVLIPNGTCAKDYFSLDQEEVLGPYIRQHPATNSTTLDPEIYSHGLYHDCEDDITEMAKVLLSHETTDTAQAKLTLTSANYGRLPRYYIECTEDRAITPFLQQKMYEEMPCKQVYQLPASHSPFFSMPEALTEVLVEIAMDG